MPPPMIRRTRFADKGAPKGYQPYRYEILGKIAPSPPRGWHRFKQVFGKGWGEVRPKRAFKQQVFDVLRAFAGEQRVHHDQLISPAPNLVTREGLAAIDAKRARGSLNMARRLSRAIATPTIFQIWFRIMPEKNACAWGVAAVRS